MPDTRLPLVNWSLTMRRGSHTDPKGKEGLASLTGDMLRRGVGGMTLRRSSTRTSNPAASRSKSIDGGDFTRVGGSSTTEQLEHGIDAHAPGAADADVPRG